MGRQKLKWHHGKCQATDNLINNTLLFCIGFMLLVLCLYMSHFGIMAVIQWTECCRHGWPITPDGLHFAA
ncbi:hypothetical protein BDV40DRAFT_259469, partial [Aspergillus tamarii]